jgi:hypothetical protein
MVREGSSVRESGAGTVQYVECTLPYSTLRYTYVVQNRRKKYQKKIVLRFHLIYTYMSNLISKFAVWIFRLTNIFKKLATKKNPN